MSAALPAGLLNDPTNCPARWDATVWHEINGNWVPLGVPTGGRVSVSQRSDGLWVVMLDGTVLYDMGHAAMTWETRELAGVDALNMLRGNWHGPAMRFRPSLPWLVCGEVPMRALLMPCHSSLNGQSIKPVIGLDSVPVAIIRSWRRPSGGNAWGVFAGTGRPHQFESIGGEKGFWDVNMARFVVDTEVGRWVPSVEW